jgi:hypothetical protein
MRDAGYPDLGQQKSCSRIIRSFDCWRQVYQLMLDSSDMEGVKTIHYRHRYNPGIQNICLMIYAAYIDVPDDRCRISRY